MGLVLFLQMRYCQEKKLIKNNLCLTRTRVSLRRELCHTQPFGVAQELYGQGQKEGEVPTEKKVGK